MYQAVLFDMDGTILDTITDLTICTNYALSQLGKPHEFPAELVTVLGIPVILRFRCISFGIRKISELR